MDKLYLTSPSDVGFSDARLETVDEIVTGGLNHVYPAAVLFVARHGGIVLHRAYGCLDPDTRRHPTLRDSLFDLASMTKLFTATAFMSLAQSGKVALETPIAHRWSPGTSRSPTAFARSAATFARELGHPGVDQQSQHDDSRPRHD